MRPSRPDRAMAVRLSSFRSGQSGGASRSLLTTSLIAVAVEVAGGVEPVERTPSLGRPSTKRHQLAVNRTPEIGEAVAVEVGGLGRSQAGDVCSSMPVAAASRWTTGGSGG